jgi:hypothetical protein
MAEAATAEEVVDEETTCQSVLRLRASGPAGTPVSLPVPGAAQLLTLASPVSLACLLAWPGRGRGDDHPEESIAFPRGSHGWAIPWFAKRCARGKHPAEGGHGRY